MTAVDLPRIPRSVPGWHDQGACNLFPELDFIEAKGAQKAACRIICAACPVRMLCATDALERGEAWGVWGGLDRRDRKTLAAEFGYPAPSVLPEHGTNARYAKHRCGCADCKRAHAVYEADRRATAREKARKRDLWRDPIALEQPTKVGRRWLPAGQLMLPLAIPTQRPPADPPTKARHLALVA